MVLQIAIMLGLPSRRHLLSQITNEEFQELQAMLALDYWPKVI